MSSAATDVYTREALSPSICTISLYLPSLSLAAHYLPLSALSPSICPLTLYLPYLPLSALSPSICPLSLYLPSISLYLPSLPPSALSPSICPISPSLPSLLSLIHTSPPPTPPHTSYALSSFIKTYSCPQQFIPAYKFTPTPLYYPSPLTP